MLEISLLGSIRITINGKPIDVASNYGRALLVFLVIEQHHPHRREALAEMLWSERPNGVARNNLKQALADLRKALGDRGNSDPYLLVSRDEIQFNQSSSYWVDALAFIELFRACEEHPHDDLLTCKPCEKRFLRTAEMYRGNFLGDFCLSDNQDFNDWILIKREVLQRQMSETLYHLAMIAEANGDVAKAIEYYRQLVELEPWNEGNHRQLMRLLALNGMRSAALRQYQTCRDRLQNDLGVEPSNATLKLYEEIKAWELGILPDDTSTQITLGNVNQGSPPDDQQTSQPAIPRKPIKMSFVGRMFIIAVLILGVGSVYWLTRPNTLAATSALENTAFFQTPLPDVTDPPLPSNAKAVLPASDENELQVLQALYEETDGPNWKISEGWLSGTSPCEWYGVTCRGEKIVGLELADNQLNGTIPGKIGQLTKLENLDLGNNQLRGSIPTELGTLVNLKHLTLWGNRELSGSIPPELGNLSDLEDLALAHWERGGSLISGEIPPELGSLKNLRSLNISLSLLRGSLPVELCSLTKLESLALDSNQLSGLIPPEIGNMSNLTFLDLGGNDFEGTIPPELGNLTMLTYLSFGGDLLSGEIPAELGKLVRLRSLVLDNTNLTGSLPLTLMNLNLREFTYFGTDVCEPTDKDFQNWLSNIQDLQNTDIRCDFVDE